MTGVSLLASLTRMSKILYKKLLAIHVEEKCPPFLSPEERVILEVMYARNSSVKAINPLFTITSRQAIEK
jgi:hypothetical protein